MAQWVQLQSGRILNIDQMYDIGIEEFYNSEGSISAYKIQIYGDATNDLYHCTVFTNNSRDVAMRNYSKLLTAIESG